jgi:glucosylceramidase
MGWTIASEATFIANNLGPALRAANLDTKILGFDHNKGADLVSWTSGLAANATARSFIYGIANHWYEATVTADETSVLQAHNAVPQFVQIATEQSIDTFGNGNPPLATWWNVDSWWWTGKWGDWALATTGPHAPIEPVLRYAKDIILTFNNWQAGWINWNAVLDQDGGPSHGARCQAPIHANTTTKEVYITPTFYVMEHFSKYIVPGAKIVPTNGALPANVMAVSAINPDATIATVILNWTTSPFDFALTAGTKTVEVSSPAMSLQTIILR